MGLLGRGSQFGCETKSGRDDFHVIPQSIAFHLVSNLSSLILAARRSDWEHVKGVPTAGWLSMLNRDLALNRHCHAQKGCGD
jgi:hypothetical protein